MDLYLYFVALNSRRHFVNKCLRLQTANNNEFFQN